MTRITFALLFLISATSAFPAMAQTQKELVCRHVVAPSPDRHSLAFKPCEPGEMAMGGGGYCDHTGPGNNGYLHDVLRWTGPGDGGGVGYGYLVNCFDVQSGTDVVSTSVTICCRLQNR